MNTEKPLTEAMAQASSAGHTLALSGTLDIYRAAEIREQILLAMENQAELTLDLAAVDDLDAAGLQILIAAKLEAQRRGTVLHLLRHSPAVLTIFQLCHLDAFFGDPLVLLRQEGT